MAVEIGRGVILGNAGRETEGIPMPWGVMRWRRDEALSAGESGRYRGRALRMKV